MSSNVEILINLINEGDQQKQEHALEIYNELNKSPFDFFLSLSKLLETASDQMVKFQACNLMETVIRTNMSTFTQEQLTQMRKLLPEMINHLDKPDFKYFVPIPMRLLKGCDAEWREFDEVTKNMKYQDEYGIQIHDHLEKDILMQSIVNDTNFTFSYAEKLLGSKSNIAPVVFLKLVGFYASLYPDRAENIQYMFPKFLDMAKNSRQFEFPVYNIFWHQLGVIFSEIAAQIPIFYDFANIAIEYSQDKSLNIYYRLIPLFMFGKSIKDISIDHSVKITNCLISLILDADYITSTLLIEKFVELLNILFACFDHKMICDFSLQKVEELRQIDTSQAAVTCLIIFLSLMENYPNWFVSHWDYFQQFVIAALPMEEHYLIRTTICHIINKMPIFFGFSIINFEFILNLIIPFVISESSDLRFTAIQALTHINEVICVTITGHLMPLLNLAHQISDDILGLYLYAVFRQMRTEFIISDSDAWEIANFIAPLYADDDFDLVDGALYIGIELICLNSQIREELLPMTFGAISRLFDTGEIEYCSHAINHLADLIETYPQESGEAALEYSELIESCIFNEENVFYAQTTIVSAAKLAQYAKFPFTQHIIEVGVDWLNSSEPSLVYCAADIFVVIGPHLDNENANQIISMMLDMSRTCPEISTVVHVMLNISTIFRLFGTELPDNIRQLGLDAIIDYISGNFEVLGGVPPESTDISISLMIAMLKLITFCVTKPSPEITEIFRFTLSLIRMGELCDEGVIYICLRILWVMIRHDVLPDQLREVVLNLTLEQLRPDLPLIYLREESHLLTLHITKKLISREKILENIETIKGWWNYIYTNRESTRPFAISMCQLIWVCVGQFQMIDELKEQLIQTMNVIELDDFEENGEMVDLHFENFKDGCTDSEIDKQNILLSCMLFCATQEIRTRMGISLKKTQELFEAQKILVQKDENTKQAVREFIGDDEYRNRILSPLLM